MADTPALARIAIDRGGTFTDAICSRKGHEDIVIKVGFRVNLLTLAPLGRPGKLQGCAD